MRGLQIRKWTILICGTLLLLLTGYIVSTGVWISADSGIRTGGEVYFSNKGADREVNVFDNASTISGKTAIIAPGSNGSYTFTIKNTKEFPVQVTWQLSDENAKKIPMQYRLKTDSEYLFGSTREWIAGEALDQYVIKDQLDSGEAQSYCLDWEWPFEIDEEQNMRDTELGNLAASGEEVSYTLNFSLRAEGEGSEEPETPEEPSEPEEPETPEEPENSENSESSDENDNLNQDDLQPDNLQNHQPAQTTSNHLKPNRGAAAQTSQPDVEADAGSNVSAEGDKGTSENEVEEGNVTDKANGNQQDKIIVNADAKEKKLPAAVRWSWIPIILTCCGIWYTRTRVKKHFETEKDVEEDQ